MIQSLKGKLHVLFARVSPVYLEITESSGWRDKREIWWVSFRFIVFGDSRRRHGMETLYTLCDGNPLVTGRFPLQKASNWDYGKRIASFALTHYIILFFLPTSLIVYI